MFKVTLKVLVVMMMFIAFIGKAMTFNASISCEPLEDIYHTVNETEHLKHDDKHVADASGSEDCCGIDCCNVDCTCITNACSSLAYVNVDVVGSNILALSEPFYITRCEQANVVSALPYRPPIFTS